MRHFEDEEEVDREGGGMGPATLGRNSTGSSEGSPWVLDKGHQPRVEGRRAPGAGAKKNRKEDQVR